MPASIAATVLVVRLVDEWASFLPAATFDSFRADLGLTYRGAALALLAIGPGAVVGSAVGVLADSRSRRVLATAGAAVYAVALGLFAAATSAAAVVAGGFAVGLGATLLVDTIEVALVDVCAADPSADGRLLERTLARMNVAAGIGDLSGPLLVAGAAALGWSWRVPVALTAVAVAVYAVLVARTPLPAPAVRTHQRVALHQVARRAEVWWAGACGAVLVALDESFIAYVIAYLHRDAGASTAVATIASGSFVVGGLVAAWLLARRERARGRHAALRAPAAVMCAGAIALAAFPTPLVVTGVGFVLGAATIAFWVPFQAMTLQLVEGRAAAVSAIVGTIEMSGLAVTPIIGAVADAWGLRAGLTAYACAPALLLVLVWCRRLPRTVTVRDDADSTGGS
jgi:predicted MFS family arabinose efflux permease